MDISLFRTSFPEFSDTVIYPDALILFWSNIAQCQVNQPIWCGAWHLGVSLYTAHNIVIAAQNKKAASFGGVPGTSGGIANTKTVGSATVGYDSASTTEEGAGWWNRTTYGQQFYRLAMLFGAKAIQL